MISNEDQLKQAVDKASILLQDITDFVRSNGASKNRIQFPRKYIRNAGSFQQKLSFINDKELKKSLSYNLIFVDVLRWLLNCTDINYTAKEMLIKYCVLTFSFICESMAVKATEGIIGKKHEFKERTKRMVAKGMIQPSLKDTLDWLWDKRGKGAHLYLLDYSEQGLYAVNDYKKASLAIEELIGAMSNYHQNRNHYF